MTVTELSLLVLSAVGGEWQAWVSAPEVYVRAQPSPRAAIIGMLSSGTRIQVRECVPTCEDPKGWAILSQGGAVPLGTLTELSPKDATSAAPTAYARVVADNAAIRDQPRPDAQLLRSANRDDALALSDDPFGRRSGYRRLFLGGFIEEAEIRVIAPSAFSGEHDPELPLAFFVRAQNVGAERVAKWSRLPLAESRGAPRSAIRIAQLQARPAGVPPEAKWIHVDLREQTLIAYEGSRAVFATLISSGKSDWETKPGLHRVWLKSLHTTMRGQREPYYVEEVPNVLFFHGSQAIHGTFWHNAFGSPVSHGCLNLSPTDAEWLFDWAPPVLPEGWHSILPSASGTETLWIYVTAAAPIRRAPMARPAF